jgi:hypothetical protein
VFAAETVFSNTVYCAERKYFQARILYAKAWITTEAGYDFKDGE